jgi:exodeoxyribonuclease X
MAMKLIVVDTETSDLPDQGGHLLELAWMVLAFTNKWERVLEYETYIQYSGPIDPRAQASHHIRPECLTAGRGAITREAAVAILLGVITPETYLVAHNSDFDSKMLPELACPWICTYRLSKKIWPEAPAHGNQVLRYWLNLRPDLSGTTNTKPRAPHQALYDVATTVEILRKMLEKHSPEELHRMTFMPNLLKAITFGKHKGTDFEDIPTDYLRWLRNQSNLDDDLKFTLDIHLGVSHGQSPATSTQGHARQDSEPSLDQQETMDRPK